MRSRPSNGARGPSGCAKALLLAGALTLLSGCATAPPQVVHMAPPPDLLAACEKPEIRVETNGLMGDTIIALKAALSGCAAQVEALAGWAQGRK